ncbi:MAG: VWA domain-containing protein, partial [Planctomycetota bacterium]
ALETLSERGIPLHTVAFEEPAGDIRPIAFRSGGILRVGQTARLLVDLVGPAADVRVRIRGAEGALVESEVLRLDGRRRVALDFEPDRAGFVTLTAEVEVTGGGDSRPGNNEIQGYFAVQDPIRVLYLGGRVTHGGKRLGELLGAGFRIEAPEAPADSAGKLESYDLVMLDDCPAKGLPRELQLELVSQVRDQGLGMCMAGGPAAFGPGGYHKTPLESVLPVELVQKEEKKDPSTALAIIIDTSGSMGGNRIVLAKEVTRLALRRLLPHDKVGIVEFYGNKRWAAPLQSAANAIDIQRALNRLDAGGGTILFPAIEEAYFGLRNVQTRYKHVLVLTDAGVESGPYEQLMRRMARDEICVSTVLVGPGRHSEFLAELADWGRGRFYHAADRFNLPEILLKQPSSARLPGYRSGVQELEAQGGRGWWGDTDPRAVPAVHGYVETRKRPGADVLLRTREDRHPILASWRFGLGRVTALATEPTGPGSEGWRNWTGYGPFLARVLSRTAADGRLPFRFELRRRDHEIVLTARRLDRGSVLPKAHVMDAGSVPRALSFRERAPGLFQASFGCPPERAARVVAGAQGRESATLRLASGPREDLAGELQVDPARALDPDLAARATGGSAWRLEALGSFRPPTGGGDRALAVQELGPLCLLLSLLLYLADLLWRRSPWRRVAE